MKKLLIVFACLLLITGCKDVKLKNGENAVVTFKEGGISSQDLYESVKKKYGGIEITNVIDSYLLNKKYKTDAKETDYVKQTIKTIKKNAEDSGASLDTYVSMYYGLSDADALEEYLTLNYKRNLYVEDYAKETVSEKQINDYYEQSIYGDVEASQILILVDAKDDATDEKKQEAENKALDKAKNIIKELKEGKDFAELAKKYSKDQNSASNGGSLGKVNTGDIADAALDELRKLKDGTYSTTPIKSDEGYHILYRTSMDDKPALKDVKDKIIETVGKEMAQEDGFSAKALKALREKNEMKFVDTNLEKQYESGK